MCLTPTNSEVEDPPTLEGIEFEHNLWVLLITRSLQQGWWNCRLTIKELLGNGPEETRTKD